jgi:SAM-dependent methyltransferase
MRNSGRGRTNGHPRAGVTPGTPRPHTPEGSRDRLRSILATIVDQRPPRSEAVLKGDIRELLLTDDFGLAEHHLRLVPMESATSGPSIDIEIGYTAIQVQKSLVGGRATREAERHLASYLRSRSKETGQRYVGILTDGIRWHAYHLQGEALDPVTRLELAATNPDGLSLFYWLEGILATRHGIRPSPSEIERRLGAGSTSHTIDRAALVALYTEHRHNPTILVKRQLWAQLLQSALGTQFVDDDELFIEHTLLTNSADVIAHLIVGIDVLEMQPATLLNGQRFDQAGILGVVEQDFFDWTVEVPGGATFIHALARRLARFDWSHVKHDILKVLYESFIGTETRRRLGEYYTPDWLAEHIVQTAVTRPLHQRVLDPACGSGTFLFYAVQNYLSAAEQAGRDLESALSALSKQVIGVDLHPVAVALARVTYLLAIGRERLIDPKRGPINVPVYLGDSVQWRERLDLFTEDHLRIRAGHGASFLEDILRFPQHLLDDPSRFDRLVANLAALAAKPRDRNTVPSLKSLFHRMAIAEEDRPVIQETFAAMCRLHDEGRNHIWSYYLRNLARPIWLAMEENRVDVLVGNPPWLSFRNMPPDMQDIFKQLSRDRGLWLGGGVATHQDLAALFTARSIQQYLTVGGSFAFVLPNSVLDREYFKSFLSGRYDDPAEPTAVDFTGWWDLRRLRPHLFRRGSCVVFGKRTSWTKHYRTSLRAEEWTGRLPANEASWEAVRPHISRNLLDLDSSQTSSQASPYNPRFNQGATIVPRLLFLVDAEPAGPLGLGSGRRRVRSARGVYEKEPWKDLAGLSGIIETEFIWPVLLGESLLPFRLLNPREAVLPILSNHLLSVGDPKLDYYPGLAEWWSRAEDIWMTHRRSARLTLKEQLDFRKKLTTQIPTPPLRLVYSKSGMHVAAAIVDDPRLIIDHKLYWGTLTSKQEGYYLSALLNNPVLTELVRPLMSYGKDERDIDKHIWKLPIPLYDKANTSHRRLASLGERQEAAVARMALEDTNFVTMRRRVRAALAEHTTAEETAFLVRKVITT